MQPDEDESASQSHAENAASVSRAGSSGSEHSPKPGVFGSASDDGEDEFFAQRTQVLTTADLANIAEDVDDVAAVEDEIEKLQEREVPVTSSENNDLDPDFGDDAEVLAADQHALASDDEGGAHDGSPVPGRAHDCLEIRTPVEEFETYVRARIETLTRLGERDQVDLMLRALELGKRKLARISGAPSA